MRKRKIISFIMTICMMVCILPIQNVMALEQNTRTQMQAEILMDSVIDPETEQEQTDKPNEISESELIEDETNQNPDNDDLDDQTNQEPGDDDSGNETNQEPDNNDSDDETDQEPGDDDLGGETDQEPGDDDSDDETDQEPDDENLDDETDQKSTEEAAEEEMLADMIIYDPQPTTKEAVQAAIDSYNAAYQDAMASGGFEAALNVAKPHWEYEVASKLMPAGYNCQFVNWDTDFGVDYYTFFPDPVAMGVITLPSGSSSSDLQNEINSAAVGDIIEITSSMSFTGVVTIPLGADITIQSDSTGPYSLTQSSPGNRHFIVEGELTLRDIILERTSGSGGGVQVNSSGIFTMNSGAVIQSIHSNTNGGGVYNSGTFTMNAGAIINGNTAVTFGGGVFNEGIFTMNADAVISENTATQSGGVENSYNGSFTMNAGAVVSNTASQGGGVSNAGKFIMNNGEINGNTAYLGAGVYNNDNRDSTAAFIMNGGEITGNNTAEDGSGGGVYSSRGTFTMNGGKIASSNTATYGGGVYNSRTSVMNMKSGAEISGNAAYYGGGVLNIGAFTLSGGKIVGNTAPDGFGGGVYLNSGAASFVMDGGEISGNTAIKSGGGVFVDNSAATLTINDGKITDNSTEGNGGGIYTVDISYTNLAISASTIFSGNVAVCYYIDADASLYPGIQSASVSIPGTFVLNNYDINYAGYPACYPIIYDANGGSGTAPAEYGNAEGETFPAAANTFTAPPGMQFKEWNTQSDGQGIGYAAGATVTMPDHALTLYAIWENVTTYTITYDANGGSGTAPTESNKEAGATFTAALNTFMAPSGMKFKEWNTQSDGRGTGYAAGVIVTMPGQALILYAIWEPAGGSNTITYSVTYNANGGSGIAPTESDKEAGETFKAATNTFTAPLRMQFKEWNTRSDGQGTSYAVGATVTMPADNLTLYAQWTYYNSGGSGSSSGSSSSKIGQTSYTITYNTNGGTGSIHLVTDIAAGSTHTVLDTGSPTLGYSYSGYAFDSWNTVADGSGSAYYPESVITVYGNITLYAQWIKTEDEPIENPDTGGSVGGMLPKTGDDSNVWLWLLSLLSMLIGGLNFLWIRRKDRCAAQKP